MRAAVAQPQAPATAARGPLWSPRPSTYRLLGPGTTITPVATSRKTARVPDDGMAAAYDRPWYARDRGAAMSGGDRPTGTLTLVFSDMEGSTRLARALGDA